MRVQTQSHILSTGSVPPSLLRAIACSTAIAQLSDHPGAVRRYIFNFGVRDKETGKTRADALLAVYSRFRTGPESGFRLCLIHAGLHLASPEKGEGEPDDEIDALEKDIAEGHEEMVIVGVTCSDSR